LIKNTVCITEYDNKIIAWLDKNGIMDSISISLASKDNIGNIYVGRVKHVLKNINACFVEFENDKLGFLSLNDIYPNRRITEGLELAVQVIKEASKNKEAVLTNKISIAGKFCIAHNEEPAINISRKIIGNERDRLRNLIPKDLSSCITLRTNASFADSDNQIADEARELDLKLSNILSICNNRKAPALCYENDPEYIRFLKNLSYASYERILTDVSSVYEKIKEYPLCEFYTDSYSLKKLYSLETKIDELLKKQIWLKSGGNIVIEYTEAMTVIDVNSAKNIAKKNIDENILKINKEAATEILRQIRLRNISGIIIIDFINMKNTESINELIAHVKGLSTLDSVRCDYVDMTKLGLMEIVRRKIKPPIYELLKNK